MVWRAGCMGRRGVARCLASQKIEAWRIHIQIRHLVFCVKRLLPMCCGEGRSDWLLVLLFLSRE